MRASTEWKKKFARAKKVVVRERRAACLECGRKRHSCHSCGLFALQVMADPRSVPELKTLLGNSK